MIRWAATRAGEVNVGVPVGLVSGFGPVRSEAVRIRVENAADPSAGTTSEPFTIVADPGR